MEETTSSQNRPKVTLIFGRICSGKGSYLKDADCRIVVSDIVKFILKSEDRTVLQNSLDLDNQIASRLLYSLDSALAVFNNVVVDGIRQVSILERILIAYPDAEMIWLEVSTEERKRRYENRKDKKDIEPFEVADNKPIELECQNIFSTFKDRLTIVNNY